MKLSTNSKIKPESSKQMAASIVSGWEQISLPLDGAILTDFVRKNAYCTSHFIDGNKVKASVTGCYNIVLDFDKGKPTFLEMKASMLKWDFSAFLHTTRSHQTGDNPVDKFRVIIPLLEPISLFELEALKDNIDLLTKLSAGYRGYMDLSTFQASRLYVAAPEAIGFLHAPTDPFNTDMPKLLNFKDLPKSSTSRQPRVSKSSQPPVSRSTSIESLADAPEPTLVITPEQVAASYADPTVLLLSDGTTLKQTDKKNTKFPTKLVVTKANGVQVTVASLNEHTPIFCPFCDPAKRGNPTSANAFLDLNSFGMKYISCSSESKTYWQEVSDEQLAYHMTKSKELILFREKASGFIIYANKDPETKAWVTTKIKNLDYWLSICKQNNLPPESKLDLPIVELSFDPGKPQGMNLATGRYNTFEPSAFYKAYQDGTWETMFGTLTQSSAMEQLKSACPIIYFVMGNILGSDANVLLMLNWLASIFRHPKHKVDTYWIIISEEQGTGKDLFFKRILSEIFGASPQTSILDPSALINGFNSIDMQCWLRGYNEVFSGSRLENRKIKNIIKDKVTQDMASITFKGVDMFLTKTFTNYIFFSNNFDAVELDKDDRRAIVVTNPHAVRILNTPEFKRLGQEGYEAQIAYEMQEFARILFTIDYDFSMSQQAPSSDVKKSLIKLSENPLERLAMALRLKDYNYVPILECFPFSNPAEELVAKYSTPDGVSISDKANYCLVMIRMHGAIPASLMKEVVIYMFGTKESYTDILTKLEVFGIKRKTIKHKGEAKAVYIYDK